MKRLLLSIGLIFGVSLLSHAFNPPDYAVNFDGDTRTVMLSTTPTSPTLILTRDNITGTQIFSTSMTFITSIALSTGSVIASTATAFQIPASSTPVSFSPDGPVTPYGGQMYAVITGTTPFTISIFRTK